MNIYDNGDMLAFLHDRDAYICFFRHYGVLSMAAFVSTLDKGIPVMSY